MYPEKKYELFNFLKVRKDLFIFNHKFKKKFPRFDYCQHLLIESYAIQDILDYYNINLEDLWRNNETWHLYEEKLWNESISTINFYKNWNKEYSEYNACANLVNQLKLIELQKIITFFFSKEGLYLDYGCGTGTISLGLKINNFIKGKLILLEVPNDVQNFVNYRINKYNLSDSVQLENIFNYSLVNIADGIICIDVLEHIENSSDVFINKIAPLIKCGGFLIMRAPWRGQLTHIDCAADDFYRKGGKEYLNRNFKEILRFEINDIACVYKKL